MDSSEQSFCSLIDVFFFPASIQKDALAWTPNFEIDRDGSVNLHAVEPKLGLGQQYPIATGKDHFRSRQRDAKHIGLLYVFDL